MRKLVTLRKVSKLTPIEGKDVIELAEIDGWQCIVKKGEFAVGDYGFYFECDSVIPINRPSFEFLKKSEKTHLLMNDEYMPIEFTGTRIKTMKMGGVVSQGLLLPVGVLNTENEPVDVSKLSEEKDYSSAFGVVKYEKYVKLGGESKGSFPWFLSKSDQERVQNIKQPFFDACLNDEVEISIKLDGSSLTAFYIPTDAQKYGVRGDGDSYFGVCSRNQEITESNDSIFWQVVNNQNILEKLKTFGRPIAIQGELVSPTIQGNYEKVDQAKLFVYNVFDIESGKYLPTDTWTFDDYVPVLFRGKLSKFCYDRPDLIEKSDGQGLNEGVKREGIVVKQVNNNWSFKVISKSYLLHKKD